MTKPSHDLTRIAVTNSAEPVDYRKHTYVCTPPPTCDETRWNEDGAKTDRNRLRCLLCNGTHGVKITRPRPQRRPRSVHTPQHAQTKGAGKKHQTGIENLFHNSRKTTLHNRMDRMDPTKKTALPQTSDAATDGDALSTSCTRRRQ